MLDNTTSKEKTQDVKTGKNFIWSLGTAKASLHVSGDQSRPSLDTIGTYDIHEPLTGKVQSFPMSWVLSWFDDFWEKTAVRKKWGETVARFLDDGDARQTKVAASMRMCGGWWLRKGYTSGDVRYITTYCGRRWCPICANKKAKEKARKLLPYLTPLAEQGLVSHLVLTLKNSYEIDLARLWTSWRKLSRRKWFKDAIEGSLANVEFTVDDEGRYHWHLHVLLVGERIPQDQISAAWEAITGDSKIVWIRRVGLERKKGIDGVVGAVFETVKYVSKSSEVSKLGKERFLALDLAIKGRRLTASQGCFREWLRDSEEEVSEQGEEIEEGRTAEMKTAGKKDECVSIGVFQWRDGRFVPVFEGTPEQVRKSRLVKNNPRLAEVLRLSDEEDERRAKECSC